MPLSQALLSLEGQTDSDFTTAKVTIPNWDQHLAQPTTDCRLSTFTYGDCICNGVDMIDGNEYVDTDPVQAHQVTLATADDCAECAYAIAVPVLSRTLFPYAAAIASDIMLLLRSLLVFVRSWTWLR